MKKIKWPQVRCMIELGWLAGVFRCMCEVETDLSKNKTHPDFKASFVTHDMHSPLQTPVLVTYSLLFPSQVVPPFPFFTILVLFLYSCSMCPEGGRKML